VMAASAIVISSDSSDESVGSPPSRIILFGSIPTVIPVIPVSSSETPVVSSVAPHIGLHDLIPYSDSDSDSPDDMASPEYISPLPVTSLFLCIDSSETSDPSDGLPSQDPYVIVVARWRSKVASRLSLSFEFPIAPITAPPRIHRRPAILIRPGEVIPFGRSYHTHPNRPRKLLTSRKRVGPIPARRLIWRHVSPRSSDHRSSYSNSSSDSSPVHSLGFDTPGQAYYGPSIIDASPRLVYPPVRAPRHSEAFLRWRAVSGLLAHTRVDLLPPRKRFKDSYLSEASMKEDTELGTAEAEVGMELETSAGDMIELGIDPVSAPIVDEEIVEPAGEDSSGSSGTRDCIVRSFEDMPIDLDDVVRGIYHHMSNVRINRIVEIETIQRQLEADQLIASGERTSMVERIESLRLENHKVRALWGIERDQVDSLHLHITMTNTRSGMNLVAIAEMINQRVTADLEAREVNRNLGIENENGNGGGDGNGDGNNGGDNGNGNGNRNVNIRGDMLIARECTYQDFMKCQPLNFKGTKGVVGLIRWWEKMEIIFHISNCP
ncbi:hypothetical protein Tco_0403601, partial [Tanacetum coccineum]